MDNSIHQLVYVIKRTFKIEHDLYKGNVMRHGAQEHKVNVHEGMVFKYCHMVTQLCLIPTSLMFNIQYQLQWEHLD